jgi:hypothetical protein
MSDKPKDGGEKTIFDPQQATQRYSDNFTLEPTIIDPASQAASGSAGVASGVASGPKKAANEPRRAISAKPPAANTTLPVGFRLFEYRIDGVLGQGGFGIAYAATDVNLN